VQADGEHAVVLEEEGQFEKEEASAVEDNGEVEVLRVLVSTGEDAPGSRAVFALGQ
jgi:hypothetical protein